MTQRTLQLLLSALKSAHDFLDDLHASENADLKRRISHAIEIDEAHLRTKFRQRGRTIYELQQHLSNVRSDACLLSKVIGRVDVTLNEEELKAWRRWSAIGRASENSSKKEET